MDTTRHNAEIEKIANLMVHDDISTDEQDPSKLQKYQNIVMNDCTLDEKAAMDLVYETLLYRKLKSADSGNLLEKGGDFGAGFS
ncbi:MAG: hypothetical protein D9C04_06130 [Nitrosopumilus sp. B06]|nr:MAG: hypothetical protein D9C04_06130 [Nitrosopumilus sp. B06]